VAAVVTEMTLNGRKRELPQFREGANLPQWRRRRRQGSLGEPVGLARGNASLEVPGSARESGQQKTRVGTQQLCKTECV